MSKQLANEVMDVLDGRSGDKQYRLNQIREICTAEIGLDKPKKKKSVAKKVVEVVMGNED